MIITIIVFFVVLSLMVFVHELGHFVMARKFKVRVDEFGLGLPPRIFGLRRNRKKTVDSSEQEIKKELVFGKEKPVEGEAGTIYSLNWIPVGGFVKLKGENGEDPDVQDSFASKKIWKRAVILVAGVTMNVLLCMVLLSFCYFLGMPQIVESGANGGVSEASIQVLEVAKDLPAGKAGVETGDVFLSVDDQSFANIDGLKSYLLAKKGQNVIVKIGRNKEELIKEILVSEYDGNIGIGVGLVETALVKYPWYSAIYEGVKTTFVWIGLIAVAFAMMIRNLVTGAPIGAEVAGPVGIAVLTGQAAKMGFVYLLQFTALLSLNLAIINAIPFPALDGGRLLFLLIEKIRGKVMNQKWENAANNIGFILLMILILFITFKDVAKHSGPLVNIVKNVAGM